MITRDNLEDVIKAITPTDKKRILRSDKEYIVIYLSVFNSGCIVSIRLTNNFDRYKNVSNDGHAILCIDGWLLNLINN